jgi:hypothetical protein
LDKVAFRVVGCIMIDYMRNSASQGTKRNRLPDPPMRISAPASFAF